jgi:FtsP/CotA-like multicopper oxidase with cupredoxin domain
MMNCSQWTKNLMRAAMVLAVLTLAAGPSFGAVVDLKAEARDVTLPNGAGGTVAVPMWGFFDPADTSTEWKPGPTLRVTEGDSLTINLTNSLSEAASIVIAGQTAALAPVTFTDAQGRERVSSFTAETGAGGAGVYTWSNLKAGTYLYHSGTHPAKQVQMGLYGVLIVDPVTPGTAYTPSATNPNTAFTSEVVLLYSEIDPALHDPPAAAQPLKPTADPGSIPRGYAPGYVPAYFLINGKPYEAGDPAVSAGNVGENVLIRFVNAGLKTHVPTLLNAPYMSVIAEDGNLYPYAKSQYSVLLAAGKTLDAIWTPTAANTYAMMDRANHLTTAGATGGGMLTRLQVGTVAGAPVAVDDGYTVAEDSGPASHPSVLANDNPPTGLTAELVSGTSAGTLLFNADGTFTYTPNADFRGTDIFTYKATDGTLFSNVATVRITVTPANDPPVAVNDAAATLQDTPVMIDVLANDSDVDNDPLMVMGITDPRATVDMMGMVTFTPAPGDLGDQTFTYMAYDGTANSNMATVTVTVNAPVNTTPVAVDDNATTKKNTQVFINLVANDTDAEGNLKDAFGNVPPERISIVTQPTRGGTVIKVTNGVNYTPRNNFRGTDVFTYTVSDSGGLTSNIATVRVNVTR